MNEGTRNEERTMSAKVKKDGMVESAIRAKIAARVAAKNSN
jgi:hypothetical protein